MGLDLFHASRNAATARRMRTYIKRIGSTPSGHPLWTKEEDAKMRHLYPDYKKLQRALRRRTYCSLRNRARSLGIAKKRHTWKGEDIVKLRKLYPEGSRDSILSAFPGVEWSKIAARANAAKIWRRRRPFKITGHSLLDAIRARAFELNISMVDLDDMAKTKRYFQKAQWISSGVVNRKMLLRAIEALNGNISIEWRKYN